MSDGPVAYTAEADVPLTPIEGESDQRVLDVQVKVTELQEFIRQTIPYGPSMELALRYVDLAVQAARQATQDGPPQALGEVPQEQAAPRP